MTTAITKRIAKALMLCMIICMMTGMLNSTAYAARKYRLPSKCKIYEYENGKLSYSETEKYKYDKKGNPVRIINRNYPLKIKNTYKKGRLVKVTLYDKYKEHIEARYYNSKGRPVKDYVKIWEDEWYKGKYKLKTDKKGFVLTNYESRTSRIKYYRNGMPKMISGGALFDDADARYTFRSNGLVKTETVKSEYEKTCRYRIRYKKAKNKLTMVNEKKVRTKAGKYKWQRVRKVVYTFGKTKTRKAHMYIAMVNRKILNTCLYDYVIPEHLSLLHFFK